MPSAARGVVIVATIVGLLLTSVFADWSGALFFAAFTGIGAYLVIQRPTNSVGWFLMTTGSGLAIGSVRATAPIASMLAGRLDGLAAFAAWANGVGWAFAFVGFFGVTMAFPNGRLPAGRGRWPSRIGFAALIGLAGLLAFAPMVNVTPALTGIPMDVPNPLALVPDASFWTVIPDPSLLFPVMFAVLLLEVVALIRRYRASAGLERMQYRWLVAAIAFVAITNFSWAVATFGFQWSATGPAWLLVVVAYPTVPIAIVVAILRYRLYEIDRILSRTIAYAIVTAIVAGVFGIAVLLLSTGLASFAQGQTIAVAASTLAAYAIFQPVLRRIRHDVDRRFDRRRYDGERTVATFSARLRDETNMEAVTSDLTDTISSAVAPASLSLWLRSRDMTQ